MIHSSSDVSDTYLWLCAVSLQIDFYFPFFKGVVLLSIQPGLGRSYNRSGHFGEKFLVLAKSQTMILWFSGTLVSHYAD